MLCSYFGILHRLVVGRGNANYRCACGNGDAPVKNPFVVLRYRFYEECSDLRRLVRQLGFYQDEYNLGGKATEISLVFFPDAVRHLLRISRILRQPRGNAILIGLAGQVLKYFQ